MDHLAKESTKIKIKFLYQNICVDELHFEELVKVKAIQIFLLTRKAA